VRVFVVVNHVRTQRPTYTTLHIAFEAYRRGHEVRFASASSFSFDGDGDDDRVIARGARPVAPGATSAAEYCRRLVEDTTRVEIDATKFDVVLLRNNPSVQKQTRDNPALDFARRLKRGGALVLNDPDGLERAGSKMYLAGFPEEIRPRTLVSRSPERIKEFLRELDGPAVLKPLSGFGGKNVFYVRRGQVANLNQMIGAVRQDGYVIAQEYLPAVEQGDKRVLLLGGEPIRLGAVVAAYRRMRPKGDIRNNMHVGGQRRRCDFGEVDEHICRLIRPRLQADGLYLVGADLVGDKLLEVNVFAPGGIHNIDELYGVNVGEVVVRDLEARVQRRGAARAG
jgi:glutathione synthase